MFFGLGGGIAGATLLVTGGVFYLIGKLLRAQAEKAKRIALHGLQARGTVLSVQPTGTVINDVPQMSLRVRVEIDGRAPYEASVNVLVPPHQIGELAAGAVLSLRVDPENMHEVAVEG
jgi:hypothetical protein